MARPLTTTAYNNTSFNSTTKKFGSHSVYFDGTDDHTITDVDSSFNLGSSNFTIELWAYPTDIESGISAELDAIFYQTNGFRIYVDNPGAGPRVVVNCNNVNLTPNPSIISSAGSISENAWQHIAVVKNGNTVRLYINGTDSGNMDVTGINIASATDIYLGIDANDADRDYTGYIDELRVSNIARYTGNFTVRSTAFTDDIDTLLLLHFDNNLDDDLNIPECNISIESICEVSAENFNISSADLDLNFQLISTATENPNIILLGNDIYNWDQSDTWDSIYTNDDKWVVWEILPTTFVLEAQPINLKLASADFSTQIDVNVLAQRIILGNADLVVSFNIEADSINLDLAFADLTTNFNLFVSAGLQLGTASADLNSNFDLTAIALNLDIAASLLAFDFETETKGSVINNASADLSASFALSSSALNLDIAVSLLVFDFQAEINGGIVKDAVADLNVSTALTAQGEKFIVGKSNLDLSFDIIVSADNFNIAAALLAFDFAVTPRAGLILEPNELVDYTWDTVPNDTWDTFLKDQWEARGVFQDSQFILAPIGGLLQEGEANLTAFATELIVGERLPGGSAALQASFTITTKPTLIPAVLPFDLPVITDLTASADLFVGGKADLEAFATELVVGERLPGGSAEFTVNTELSALANIQRNAQAALEVFGFQFSEGRLSDVRGQANLQFAFQGQFEGDLRLLPSELVYKVLRDQRKWTILGETRHYGVLPENRDHSIDDESTTLMILPESRVLDVEEMSA